MERTKICVVGDICLDESRLGQSHRWSPEDSTCAIISCPVTEYGLGGAGNVANWLAHGQEALVEIIGLVVADKAGDRVHSLCYRGKMQVCFPDYFTTRNRRTTVKERTCLLNEKGDLVRQLVRCDWDSNITLNDYGRRTILERLDTADLIVVADYGKGVFEGDHGAALRRAIGTQFPQGVIVVNSKTPQRWQEYKLDALICNSREAEAAWGGALYKTAQANFLVITASENGVLCLARESMEDGIRGKQLPSQVKQLVDPTGAGDAFAAGFALELYKQLKNEGPIGRKRTVSSLQLEGILHQGLAWAADCCSQIGCGAPSQLSEREGSHNGNADRVEVTGRV